MIWIVFISVFSGFYILYQTSGKTAIKKSGFALWLNEHTLISKTTALVLIIGGCIAGALQFGLAVSIFYTLSILMTISSFMIILYPLYYPKNKK